MDLKGLLDGFSGVMSESGSETLFFSPLNGRFGMTVAYRLLSLDFCFTHSFPQLVPDATNSRADVFPFCGFSTPATLTLIPCITMALRVDTALPHTLPPSILPPSMASGITHLS